MIGEAVVAVIGWCFLMGFLGAVFFLGQRFGSYVGIKNPDVAGLLSVITVVWIYERRDNQARYDRLIELLTHQGAD